MKILIGNFFVITCFLKIGSSQSSDLVVNSTVDKNWASLLFIIPVDVPHNVLFFICRKHSNYYCLHAYTTNYELDNMAFQLDIGINGDIGTEGSFVSKLKVIRSSAGQECRNYFQSIFRKHNLFMFKDGCCRKQYCHYYTFGYFKAMMTPKEYYEKITDYSETGKQLNFIMAYYSPDCFSNIITQLGFGIGDLRRTDQLPGGIFAQQPGAPYLLKVGYHWTPKIPYANPADFITITWFKKNIICVEQPWICGERTMKFRKWRMWWRRYFGKKPDFQIGR